MLTMRPARAADQDPIARMIHARSAWLRERGMPGWEDAADGLAAQATQPEFPVWVLTDHDRVIGCTSLYDESPAWFWTASERAEPALFMATTVTDPDYAGQRVGCRIAWWALDHAARTGHRWVRRGTTEPRLVRYYRDVQGWEVVREKARDGTTVTGLTRRARRLPDPLATSVERAGQPPLFSISAPSGTVSSSRESSQP